MSAYKQHLKKNTLWEFFIMDLSTNIRLQAPVVPRRYDSDTILSVYMNVRNKSTAIRVSCEELWNCGGKVQPRTGQEGPQGEQMYCSTLSSTWAIDGVGWSTPRPGRSTHCIGVWVGPRAGLDRCGKSRPPPAFDLRTAQPVASRYTD